LMVYEWVKPLEVWAIEKVSFPPYRFRVLFDGHFTAELAFIRILNFIIL
jgi:hypothetical protein